MKNQVTKERTFSAITVDSVTPHDYKDEVLSAQIRQLVTTTTTYPGKNVSNDKQSSLFNAAEFGGEPKIYTKESKRVAWIEVPLGTTVAQVEAKLAALGKQGRIYQIVSTDVQDCLTDNHRHHIDEGNLVLKDAMAKRSIPEKDNKGNLTGNPVTDSEGAVIFRALYFDDECKEDVNLLVKEVITEKEALGSETSVA